MAQKLTKLPKLIGVIHLPPLPGAPGSIDGPAALHLAGATAVKEAKALQAAGFDGIILENFGDAPFYKEQVGPETVAALSAIALAVRESFKGALGINVLRNDARSAMAIASVIGCDFIRVNVLSGVAATDQGWIEGNAADLIRYRKSLGSSVAILADVHVKHAQNFSTSSIELAVEEALGRGGADAVIVTGSTTGRAVDLEELANCVAVAKRANAPVYVGSGANERNLADIKLVTPHLIVGSALRKQGLAGNPLDVSRCKKFVKLYKSKARVVRGSKLVKKTPAKRKGKKRKR